MGLKQNKIILILISYKYFCIISLAALEIFRIFVLNCTRYLFHYLCILSCKQRIIHLLSSIGTTQTCGTFLRLSETD